MKDINNPLLKAYFDKISPLYPCYEGEAPDDIESKLYVTLSSVNSTDVSTKSSNDHSASIQVSVHSWEFGYNNAKDMNTAAGVILTAIRPNPYSTLDVDGVTVVTTSVQDNTQEYGKLNGRTYITRNLIFSHLISY